MTGKVVIVIAGFLVVALIALLGFGVYKYDELRTTYQSTATELASTSNALTLLESEAQVLEATLATEQERNGTFAKQISTITSTVGTLDKLARTDKELLAKYSKVYFLSEHYTPEELATIDSKYVHP